MKKENGITLVSLIITIVLMFIIAGTTVYTSMDRFEINKLKKMYNDIELLSDKVASYYLKYNVLPIKEQYSTTLNFDKNANDSGDYYIIDLEALEGISLNYGKEGFESPNESDDVYIINEKTHQIYYVKGIEMKGLTYHTLENKNTLGDNIPPTKPEIKVISGTVNSAGIYTSDVELEIVPGKDNWSGFENMHVKLIEISQGEKTIINKTDCREAIVETITSDGDYKVIAGNKDKTGNNSEETVYNFTIKKASGLEDIEIGDYVAYNCLSNSSGTISYTSLKANTGYWADQKITISTNPDWRVLSINKASGEIEITTAVPECNVNASNNKYWLKGAIGYINGTNELNNIAKIYGNGEYAVLDKSRNINVDDINTINGYTNKTASNNKYGIIYIFTIDDDNNIRVNGLKDSNNLQTQFIYYNGTEWIDLANTSNKTVEITNTDFEYTLKEETVGQRMLKYDGETTNKSNYWLATPVIGVFSPQAYIRYSVKEISNGKITTTKSFRHSYYTTEQDTCAGLRPVVTLKAGITYTKDSQGVWQLSE